MYYAAMAVTVASNVLYHVFQKLMPTAVHPMLALIAAYVSAAVLCVLLLPFFPFQSSLADEVRRINWTSLGLALAIVGLEAGFLLAYRAGGEITTAGLISNTTVAMLLVPVGVAFFKERPSAVNGVGILVCLAGLVLVNWRR